MVENYNEKEHSQLLKYSKELAKQGKNLADEDHSKYVQLFHYSVMVYTQLTWEMKDQLLKIVKQFLENKISSFELSQLFQEKVKLNDDFASTNALEIDNIHEKADRFTNFVDDILLSYDLCDPTLEPEIRLPGHITETEFKQEVKDNFLDLQKFLED